VDLDDPSRYTKFMRRSLLVLAFLLALASAACKDKRPKAERLAEQETRITQKIETLKQRQQQITVKLAELEKRLEIVRRQREHLENRWNEPTNTPRRTPTPSS
jgi:septal ring factor EnvC (AmiA/AmiB activator)